LSQLLARWKAAQSEARAEAKRAMRRVDETLIRKVIEHNRQQTCQLLVQALAAVENGVKDAVSLTEANTLLDHTSLPHFLTTVSQIPEVEEAVIEKALELPVVYLQEQWHLQNSSAIALHVASIRQALTNLTSTRVLCSSTLQYIMAKVYFVLASAAVTQGQRSWDEFFEPRSSHSLDMFIDDRHLSDLKAHFYHCLLAHQTSHYELELRVPVFNHWLHVLLQTSSDYMACSLLTAGLFRHEKACLGMPSLAALFQPPDSETNDFLLGDRLPEVRHAAVKHVIKNLHSQENNAEADWLVGGLDEADAVRLLSTVFSTLKETWISLSEQPEEQDMYTVLIHLALNEYDIYPRTDFTVDSWFFNSSTFPQRQKYTFAKLFVTHFDTDEHFRKETRQQFNHEITHAVKYGRLTSLGEQLKETLLPTVVDEATCAISQKNMLLRHADFVNEIVPSVVDVHSTYHVDVSIMMLKVLIYVLENLECRTDTLARLTTQPLIEAMARVISVLSQTLSMATSDYNQLTFNLTRLTYRWTATILDDPQESFMSDVAAICDLAAETGGEEAMLLLDTVMRGL